VLVGLCDTVDDFDRFYAENYEPMVRSLTIAFRDRAAAEDAAQVGFEKALLRWRRISSFERPATWVYVVAVRSGRSQLARDRRGGNGACWGPNPIPQDAVVSMLWLQDAIDRLPPRQRTVVVLRHLADLSLQDIARALHLSLGTVKSTLHTAHRRLQVDLSDRPDEERRSNDAR